MAPTAVPIITEIDNPHVSFVVDGVRVFFPFEPYTTQRDYVESVIKALNGRHHALLESPTGTGKTLSLLCSSLAWLQKGMEKCVIYYTSRTHLQLGQAAKEMKRTAYARNPAVVIGSRAQMCLNEEVRQQGDQLINRACRNAIAKNSCAYHNNYDQKLEVLNQDTVNDIEDLMHFGRKHQCCPYYASRKIAESKASVVFMPYNYLLDSSLRKNAQLKLENSLIIFDEAHNVDGALKESVSATFTESCLSTVRESCLKLPEKIHEALNKELHGFTRAGFDDSREKRPAKENGKQDKEVKVNPIEELAEKLTTERLQQVNRCAEALAHEIRRTLDLDKTSSIDKLFHTLENSGVNYTTSDCIITTLDSMSSFWSIAGVMNPKVVARYVTATSNLFQFISLLYPNECLSLVRQQQHKKRLIEFYTAFLKGIYEQNIVLKKGDLKDWELNLWCLHPAIGLQKIMDSAINGPRSLIFTSGTLAPMKPLEKELELEFKIVREFKHVINETQLKICIIGQAPNSYSLASHYEATKKDEYCLALGKTLLLAFKILPFGTLVFFQSYPLMNRVIKYWKEKCNIWRDLSTVTRLFIESRTQSSFLSDIKAYKSLIDSSSSIKRAVFFGVCRGKLSEGINLEGNHCRTVVLTGLPFPSVTDPKVISTKKFHGKKSGDGGNLWYSNQMTRALNQTIGRVIRSKSDYGMLLLCDPRFKNYKYSLSQWTTSFFPATDTPINEVEREVKNFFSQHDVNITDSAAEDAGAFQIGLSRAKPDHQNRLHQNNTTVNAVPTVQSAKDLRSAMLSAYTVDRETYQRVQSQRTRSPPEPVEDAAAKKPKLTVEMIDQIFSVSPRSSASGQSQRSKQSQQSDPSQPAQPQSTQPPQTVQPDQSVPPNQMALLDQRPAQPDVQSLPSTGTFTSSLDNSITNRPAKSLNIFKSKAKSRKVSQPKPSEPSVRLVSS